MQHNENVLEFFGFETLDFVIGVHFWHFTPIILYRRRMIQLEYSKKGENHIFR
jgi:hypothetical protein